MFDSALAARSLRTSGRSRGMCSLCGSKLNLMILHRGFTLFGLLPIGGRSTAIKLQAGGVWILASTPLTDDTKEKLAELGEVK